MTKPKRSRARQEGGLGHHHRPYVDTDSRHANTGKQSAAVRDFDVRFEWIGEYYDDVLVTHEYDERAVKATRALMTGAGYWDAYFKVWRIHPGYADRLVVTLRDLGYTVIEVITNSAPRDVVPRGTGRCNCAQ
jgi:hypothetical protein